MFNQATNPVSPGLPSLSEVVSGAPTPPPDPPAMKVRLRATKDTTEKVMAKLRRTRPRTEGGGMTDWSRSTERVLASVKYTLRLNLPPFDDATGGFPGGRVTEIYGLDGCGKTGLCMLACGMAKAGEVYEKMDDATWRKMDPATYEITAVFIDNENSLEQGQRMEVMIDGVRTPVDCVIGECDTVDLLFKSIDTVIGTLEEVEKQTKIQQFLIVAVDTIAGTSSAEEVKQEWGKVDYSRQPKQLREGFRNMIRKLNERNVFMICSNQVGDSFKPKMKGSGKISLPQDSDFSTFGGKALRYYASLRIFMVRTNFPYKLYGGQFPDGLQLHFFVSKNRQRMPLRSGRLVLLFDKGYSPEFSVLEHLKFMKMVTVGATGNITINFQKYGISDGMQSDDLEQQDMEEGEEKGFKHVLEKKIDWLDFSKKYKAPLSKLWDICVERMFSQASLVDDGSDAMDDPLDVVGGEE